MKYSVKFLDQYCNTIVRIIDADTVSIDSGVMFFYEGLSVVMAIKVDRLDVVERMEEGEVIDGKSLEAII